MDIYDLQNLVKDKTCFKSVQGTCIDLILTNKSLCLQNTGTFEIGLSDCHLLIYTMLKSKFVKQPQAFQSWAVILEVKKRGIFKQK